MQRYGLTHSVWDQLFAESTGLFQQILRVDTSNPPGNETTCAQVLKDYLAAAGVASQLAGEHPDRMNLIARLRGRRPGPALLLLGHMDVVPAEPDEWSVPPFSGQVRDGYIWGRGALDMKSQVAAQAVAVARLARAGADFAGEVVYVATADEEEGSVCGARWLAFERPDLVRCDYLLNEGGGTYVDVGGAPLFTFTVGEKGVVQFTLRFDGRGGHGSVPLHDDNAVERMGRAIAALADHEPRVVLSPTVTTYIDRLLPEEDLAAALKDPARARSALRSMLERGDVRAHLVEPLLGPTFSPTIARAGGPAVNVIPSHAELTVDCRVLPGQTEDDARREVHAALAPLNGAWRFDAVDVTAGNESPPESALRSAVERALLGMVPKAHLVPTLLCGFTDSRWFREAFPNVTAYGFCPFFAEDSMAMGNREHAADERIATTDLPAQTLFFERLVRDLLV